MNTHSLSTLLLVKYVGAVLKANQTRTNFFMQSKLENQLFGSKIKNMILNMDPEGRLKTE